MFSTFKLPSLRTRTKSLSQVLEEKSNSATVNKAPQTPDLGATLKNKKHKRRTSDVGCPTISGFRQESPAQKSDLFVPGDRLQSINGLPVDRKMNPDQISNFLDGHETAQLEIEYALPDLSSQNSLCVGSKVTNITLERSEGSLGITLRGGSHASDPMLSRPLVVTHVRPGGPAHRCGRIKVGDRILRVDNQNLTSLTLLDAQKLLQTGNANQFTTLTIEYDVNVMESVKYASGPLIVEVERHKNEELGLVLTDERCDLEGDKGNGIYIERIIPASVSDRCGALHVGDQIRGIDDRPVDPNCFKPQDVLRLLQNFNEAIGCSKLQILPFHVISKPEHCPWMENALTASTPSISGYSTISRKRYRKRFSNRDSKNKNCSSTATFCGYSPQLGVCHSETLTVCLQAEEQVGYGLQVALTNSSSENEQQIVISSIIPDTPAYKCGKLQVGDRIISVNHQYGLSYEEIGALLDTACDPSLYSTSSIVLKTEFDITDTIVPTSGIFNIKLGKWGPGLGITVTASKVIPNDPFIITDVRRGSIAYRTGSLTVGDKLLAIDGKNLDHSNLEDCFNMLQNTSDVITLKVEKSDKSFFDIDEENVVVYTVELTKKHGSLGITICGSETGFEGVTLAKLTEGGIAEKTGALHIGDRILAINGETVEKRPLSEAIRLLQMSGENVQLKIARQFAQDDTSMVSHSTIYEQATMNYPVQSPGLASVDSAVESWDSGIIDSFTVDTHTAINKIAQVRPQKKYSQNFLDYNSPYYYSDNESCSSPLPLPDFTQNTVQSRPNSIYTKNTQIFENQEPKPYDLNEIHSVRLYKDQISGDFGFTISDGLYQTGVYVDTIRPNGPAHITGALRPYDRIITINDERTAEYDCRLAYPLIISSGDKIELVISRNPYIDYELKDMNVLNWTQDNFEDLQSQFSSRNNIIVKIL